MGRMVADLQDLVVVVEGDQRLVLIQRFQRVNRLYGIGVDDLVPYPVLALFWGEFPDVFVHDHELGHGCDIKAAPDIVQGLHNLGIGIGFHCKIDLHIRHVTLELPVILPEFLVIDYKNGGAVLFGKFQQEIFAYFPDMVDRGLPGLFFLPPLFGIHRDFCHYMIDLLHEYEVFELPDILAVIIVLRVLLIVDHAVLERSPVLGP